ncbi:MAG: SufE family protein [Proteobacteria bacterium]|nr:MAG: SufE family protein [Pseudomonadota bacterium]
MSQIDDLISGFEMLGDWEHRYQYLAELGEKLTPMPDALRVEANKVKPCMSQVWVYAQRDSANPALIHFYGDCDTSIIKGVVALLIKLSKGKTPQEFIDLDIDHLFEGLKLAEHLSPNRHVGIYAIVDVMKSQASQLLEAA